MQRRLSASEPSPWLLYYHKHSRRRNHILCSLSQPHESYGTRIPHFCEDTHIINQRFNWLLLRNGQSNYSLWNSKESKSIQLPALSSESPINDYALLPLPNCKVLLLLSHSILFIRPPYRQWIEIPCGMLMKAIGLDDDEYLRQVFSCEGKLYALSHQRKLMSINVDEADKLQIQLLCELPSMPTTVIYANTHLVESGGQIFYICVGLDGDVKKIQQQVKVIEVHVFKLDFTTMLWNKAEDLMGQAFFLDQSQEFSCPAMGVEKDNIYFTLPKDLHLYSFSVRGGWLSVSLPCPESPKLWSNPIFFRPDPLPTPGSNTMFYRPDLISDSHHERKERQNKHVKEIEGVKASRSSNLPLDVLNSIANYFISSNNIFDYMSFRAICRDFWLAAPKLNLRRLQISPVSPWLQFTVNNGRVQNFVDTTYGSRFLMSMTVPNSLAETRLRYSKDGWLLMSNDDGGNSMSFYNPFTEQVIDLPDVPTEFGLFSSMWFSCVPTSPDCVVMGFGCCRLRVISFTMRDKEWHLIFLDQEDYRFFLNHSSPVFHKGAFYLLGKLGDLLIVDSSEEDPSVVEHWDIKYWDIHDPSEIKPWDIKYWDFLDKLGTFCKSLYRSYLLEWNGRLTLVCEGEVWVQVFVLNNTKMNWECIPKLGNYTFFVSQTSCLVKKATSIYMKNRIYLPRFYGNGNNILCYSLCTGRFHFNDSQDLLEKLYDTREQVLAGWIEPRYH